MLVAGDHARRDMAGDAPESWKNVLARQGLEVSWVLRGLGEDSGVQALYRRHLRELLAKEA